MVVNLVNINLYLNEDGVIDDKDRVIDGKRTPDWTGGMIIHLHIRI